MPSRTNAGRVLVVDDDPEIRSSIRRTLTSCGYQVETADSGRRAMEMVAEQPYDVLLLDHLMPGMTGMEVLQHLRSTYSLTDLPVIMLSGMIEQDLMAMALRTGANDYVAKPLPVRDLSIRMEAQLQRSRAERAARSRDSLTGLPTRADFLEAARNAICSATPKSPVHVFFVDLDWFKEINDGFGHHAGDGVLEETARRLENFLVKYGDNPLHMVARLGGDEFVLLLTGPLPVADIAKQILAILSQPHYREGLTVVPGASIGIASTGDQQCQARELVRCADLAMYEAKRGGGGQARTFEPRMHDAAIGRASLAMDLRNAVQCSEFQTVYQPEIDLRTGRIIGFECLLRWKHFQRGWVPPSHIIPLAEESGLIVPIGRWVLEQACHQLTAWQKKFQHYIPPLHMNVNLSVKQLSDPGFLADVERILASSEVIEGTLNLELTESSIATDMNLSRQVLQSLRNLRVGLKLDDFGVGYSSLAYLREFPFDCLKIDRSFVSKLNGENHRQAEVLVGMMINMAHALGLTVIAEGVETEAQRNALAELGCDSAQGFLLAKPLDPEAAEEMLRQAN